MSLTEVRAQVDSEIRDRANAVFSNYGMSASTAVQAFFGIVAATGDIPFEADPFYSSSNIERLRESERQFREGKIVVKTMEELEAMEDGAILVKQCKGHYDAD